ncbi:hypothetical protein [Streptomyces sp. NPDC052225]|uniref:hypothetical protein n=1 Tax=Streptomyces sp. NPDC052225 TaxID=3154949 RepID=UPI003423F7A2
MNGTRVTAAARLSAVAVMSAGLLATGAGLSAASDEPGAWGDTMRWKDGLSATVSKPAKFTPTAYAVGHEAGHQGVKWRIKVHNGTDEPFQASLMSVYVKAGDDGDSCEEIFDGTLGSGISGSVSPGSSGTAEFAFDVPRGGLGKVDLEVVPGFDYAGLHWVGKVP